MKSIMSFNPRKAERGRKAALILLFFIFSLLLGAWKITTGHAINPKYVERIKDGQTKRHEILTLFGDPEEINRTPEGLVYIYQSFRNKETLPGQNQKESKPVLDAPYYGEDRSKKKSTPKDSDKEVSSMLIIRFDRDGETVRSHDYKQF